MRKILSSNVFLAFVLVILISIIGYILFDEYERKKNVKILNELVKEEKDLQNIKASYEALLKDMEEEKGESIKAKNDNSSSDIKKSENDSNEIIKSEDNSNEIKNSNDNNKEFIDSKKEENLSSVSDEKIIIKSIEELSKTIKENDARIIDIFHKKKRLSKADREKLKEIKRTFSEALVKHAAIYKEISLRKKNSIETDKGDIENEK